MESRMEKFYRNDLSDYSRSKKNADLYKEVYGNYSNMEHLPISDNSSEINMNDLQNIVSSREQYKKAKMVEEITSTSIKVKEEPEEVKVTAKKVYDINELIEKARNENAKAKEMMTNTTKQHNFLQTLEVSPEAINKIKEKNVKEENNAKSNTESFPLDLLSDLKPSENTVVMEPMSEEVKSPTDDIPIDSTFIKKDKDLEIKQSKEEFYSDSYAFSKKDFFDEDDELVDNKGHAFLKILVLIVGVSLLIAVGYFCFVYFGIRNA